MRNVRGGRGGLPEVALGVCRRSPGARAVLLNVAVVRMYRVTEVFAQSLVCGQKRRLAYMGYTALGVPVSDRKVTPMNK